MNYLRILIATICICSINPPANAEPWAAPGDVRLRDDLQLLTDAGLMNIPITSWPLAWGDIYAAIADSDDTEGLPIGVQAALLRVREAARSSAGMGFSRSRITVGAATEPRIIRTFEDTPRSDGEAVARIAWLGERFAFNLEAAFAANPDDDEEFRPDGTYVGVGLGNWMLSAGWQERWWGPGRDANMIVSTNARPTPGIAIQRNRSTPFQTKWLSWMGPWTFQSFLTLLDDERVIDDAWLFGLRGSFRPARGLEIGISRSAQWCGDGRPCELDTFWNLLAGNDNSGVNVDPEDEPGNQLGGFDLRWSLPKQIPVALYLQWIGEDTRQGGPEVGDWLRQFGVEFWGSFGTATHRTHFEVSDSTCHEGGLGFSSGQDNCAYNNSIYRTGYRYQGRSIGHGMDGDGLSYSLGSTLIQTEGHTWTLSLRHIEINRDGAPDPRHTLSPTPQELTDLQLTHTRRTAFGRFFAGIGYSRLDDEFSDETSSDFTGFIRWSLY